LRLSPHHHRLIVCHLNTNRRGDMMSVSLDVADVVDAR
jgi:hypothetical protein